MFPPRSRRGTCHLIAPPPASLRRASADTLRALPENAAPFEPLQEAAVNVQ